MLWGKSNEILESGIQMRILNWKMLFEQLYSTVLYTAAVLYPTVQSSCTLPCCTEKLCCNVHTSCDLLYYTVLYCTVFTVQ